MKTYSSIENLLPALPALHWKGFFYVNRDRWRENALSAEILYLTANDEDEMKWVESEFDDLPEAAAEREMRSFFDVETLRDIIAAERRRNADPTAEDYVRAINHYAEHDAFLT